MLELNRYTDDPLAHETGSILSDFFEDVKLVDDHKLSPSTRRAQTAHLNREGYVFAGGQYLKDRNGKNRWTAVYVKPTPKLFDLVRPLCCDGLGSFSFVWWHKDETYHLLAKDRAHIATIHVCPVTLPLVRATLGPCYHPRETKNKAGYQG